MSIQVTFTFTSIAEAVDVLRRLDEQPVLEVKAEPSTSPTINPFDRPDAGADPGAAAAAVFNPPAVPPAPAVLPMPPAAVATPHSAAVVPTAAPTGAPEFDVTGLPWDARIHSDKRSKNTDGTWRQKRGLNDPAFKGKVEAELRGAIAAPPAPPATTVVPPAPSLPLPPPPGAFAELLSKYSAIMAGNPAGFHEHLAKALRPLGLTSLGQLAARPDLIPFVDQQLAPLLGA